MRSTRGNTRNYEDVTAYTTSTWSSWIFRDEKCALNVEPIVKLRAISSRARPRSAGATYSLNGETGVLAGGIEWPTT